MLNKTTRYLLLAMIVVAGFSFTLLKEEKPVLYIIGDSTVRNGDGSGKNNQWGWGSVIDVYFDTSKISVRNLAIGGRSSRTFITDGRWDKILETLREGDFVIMQFGHNDASPLDDTARARGTIKGVGMDSVEIYNPIRKIKEVVHSYGWYMRKFVNEAKAKGAIPIVCSPVPRDNWKDGKISRTEYTGWARQVADESGSYFIDLNDRIAVVYEQMDTAKVNGFFPADHTHTNKEGAELNAWKVVEGIKDLKKCKLKNYLR
ncbi:MAG TPA: rhamnogalacturonan acetylesterase [Chitinophagaceae bacterium]|nr:rhamnogalacturonan acetylesterase [Chitinophagaceae bacterium]